MDLSSLRPVYEHDGPFATLYLEGRAPGEDAARQIRLRWQAQRERLEREGADPRAVEALEQAVLRGSAGEEQTDGRVLVAAADAGIVLDEPWDAALGTGDAAHWTVLPELGPYAREAARAVRALVVVADREGARIRREVVAEQHAPEIRTDEEVTGDAVESVHKPASGGLSHPRIHRRAEEATSRNADEVASVVTRAADAFRPRVLVLAGDVQGRTALRGALPGELGEIVVETDRGGLVDGASEEALTRDVVRIAAEESTSDAENRADRLNTGLAHDEAAQGGVPVAAAAEMGAVDTLLFEEGRTASREALLLKTCAGTDSTLALVPEGTGLTDGVGALLRFPLEESVPLETTTA